MKKIKKNAKNICHGCKKDAGLLLVTLPANAFLRKRTEEEEKRFASLIEDKTLDAGHVKQDRLDRMVRLCPQCIKLYRKKYGVDKDGNNIPVQMWGQRGK